MEKNKVSPTFMFVFLFELKIKKIKKRVIKPTK